MKRIIFIAFTLFALVSCEKEVIISDEPETIQEEILYSVNVNTTGIDCVRIDGIEVSGAVSVSPGRYCVTYDTSLLYSSKDVEIVAPLAFEKISGNQFFVNITSDSIITITASPKPTVNLWFCHAIPMEGLIVLTREDDYSCEIDGWWVSENGKGRLREIPVVVDCWYTLTFVMCGDYDVVYISDNSLAGSYEEDYVKYYGKYGARTRVTLKFKLDSSASDGHVCWRAE